MANIELVIKIPEEWLKDMKQEEFCMVDALCEKILNGTPLPKGHGRLIDADAYLIKERPRGIDEVIWKESHMYKSITEAPTIIEKDKEIE